MTVLGKNPGLSRRHILLPVLALPLAGCDIKPYGASLSDWGSALGAATGLEAGPAITRQQASDIPFATIGFRIGNSAQGILILAEKSGDGSLWTSSARRAILTMKGRIRQTAGFKWNLSSTRFVQEDPVGTTMLLNPVIDSFHRVCDFADIRKYQVSIVSKFEIQKAETITILEADLKTTCVAETCHCESLDWDFTNYYWIDQESGFVWRSSQTVHPNEDPYVVEVLRPEA